MRFLRLLTISALTLVVACDGSDTSDVDLGNVPPDLVGTWVATSLTVAGVDVVAGGTMFEITFTANNDYQFITTDAPQDLFCDGTTSCSSGGVFAVQGNTFVFDADEPDAADRTELSVTTLTATAFVLSGAIDGEVINFVFARK
jgi:hypothetical protein